MIAALEVPIIRERARPLTLEQYHALVAQGQVSNDMELLNGVLVEKMPKSPRHVNIVQKLFMVFLKTLPDGFLVNKEDPLTIGESEPEPDISIIRGSIGDYPDTHPTSAELVIEVAVSSLELDRAKADIYAAAAVPEYIIIDADNRKAIVHRKPVAGKYTVMIEQTSQLQLELAQIKIQFDVFL
jgi:Uma2 family endonuclease